jgi:hypothetical protein
MITVLNNMIARALQHRNKRSPCPCQRPVQLRLETLEDRLVPAAPAVGLPAPMLAPALVAHADGGGTHIAEPERCHCVHGYKWRPRPLALVPENDLGSKTGGTVAEPDAVHGYKWRKIWPREVQSNQGEVHMSPLEMAVRDYHAQTYEVAHLIAGGADQGLALISANGHLTVHPPEGPLPTDFRSAFGG